MSKKLNKGQKIAEVLQIEFLKAGSEMALPF